MSNSKRKCKFCKEYVREYVKYPAGVFCSVDHALEFARQPKVKEIAKKKKTAFSKKAHRENDLKTQLKLTQQAFNKMIRTLDDGKPCISCGKPVCGSSWDCGHFQSVGAHPELRFDPRNAFRQGSACNRGVAKFRANEATIQRKYEQNLIDMMGQDYVDFLKRQHPPKKYTCQDLIEMRSEFLAEIKRLESGEGPSRNWRELGDEDGESQDCFDC